MKRPHKSIIIEALHKAHGIKTNAAESLNCSRTTLNAWIEKLDLHDDVKAARGHLLDMAENIILRRLEDGDYNAAKYVLMCFGGSEWNDKAKTDAAVRRIVEDLAKSNAENVRPLVIWGQPTEETEI